MWIALPLQTAQELLRQTRPCLLLRLRHNKTGLLLRPLLLAVRAAGPRRGRAPGRQSCGLPQTGSSSMLHLPSLTGQAVVGKLPARPEMETRRRQE